MSGSLEERIASLEAQLRELRDRQEITDVLYRASRAVDRGDIALMESCFHPDGLDYRGVANGPAANSRDALRAVPMAVLFHATTNVLIELDGDVANTESYVTAFHHHDAAPGIPERDELIRARYVDRFERRDGCWKIACRITVWDWSGMNLSSKTWFEAVEDAGLEPRFIYGRRDREDASYTRSLPPGLFAQAESQKRP